VLDASQWSALTFELYYKNEKTVLFQEDEQYQLLEAAKIGSIATVTRLITTRHIDANITDMVTRYCLYNV